MKAKTRAWLASLLLVGVVIACAAKRVAVEGIVGEWEKQDNSLPPIHLVLSKDGIQIRARLRLSGVDLSGTAQLDGDQLRLNFSGRNEIKARFTSATTLLLAMGDREYLLSKRP